MQREEQTYPIVSTIRPLVFWYKCRFCDKEFRREVGFKIIDLKACININTTPTFISYSCSRCAKTKDEVKDKIKKSKLEFMCNKPKFK